MASEIDEAVEHFEHGSHEYSLGLHSTFVLGNVLSRAVKALRHERVMLMNLARAVHEDHRCSCRVGFECPWAAEERNVRVCACKGVEDGHVHDDSPAQEKCDLCNGEGQR